MYIMEVILAVLLVAAVAAAAWAASRLSAGERQVRSLREENGRLNETVTALQKGVAERDALVAAGQASVAVLESRVADAGSQLEKSAGQVQQLTDQ